MMLLWRFFLKSNWVLTAAHWPSQQQVDFLLNPARGRIGCVPGHKPCSDVGTWSCLVNSFVTLVTIYSAIWKLKLCVLFDMCYYMLSNLYHKLWLCLTKHTKIARRMRCQKLDQFGTFGIFWEIVKLSI